jgi:hypothetical protein
MAGRGDLASLAGRLERFGLRSWADALLGARRAERPDAARAAAAKCEADLRSGGWPEPEFTSLPAALRSWADDAVKIARDLLADLKP